MNNEFKNFVHGDNAKNVFPYEVIFDLMESISGKNRMQLVLPLINCCQEMIEATINRYSVAFADWQELDDGSIIFNEEKYKDMFADSILGVCNAITKYRKNDKYDILTFATWFIFTEVCLKRVFDEKTYKKLTTPKMIRAQVTMLAEKEQKNNDSNAVLNYNDKLTLFEQHYLGDKFSFDKPFTFEDKIKLFKKIQE